MSNRTAISLFLGSVALLMIGCRSAQPSFVSAEGGHIPVVNRSHDSPKGVKMDSILDSYKQELDLTMQEVLTIASKPYPKTAPDYAIQQVTIQALMEACEGLVKEKIDGAIMNIDGVRGSLSKGNVTLGIAFSLFPFDNQMSILTIKGKYLKELELLHNSAPKIVTSGFADFSDDRLYTIATIDYLTEGNDNCELLKKAAKETKTTLMLRDIMIDYFKKAKL